MTAPLARPAAGRGPAGRRPRFPLVRPGTARAVAAPEVRA